MKKIMGYRYFLREFDDYYSENFRIPSNGNEIINEIPYLENTFERVMVQRF